MRSEKQANKAAKEKQKNKVGTEETTKSEKKGRSRGGEEDMKSGRVIERWRERESRESDKIKKGEKAEYY